MTMDRYFTGVMGVLYGDRDPAEAIAEMEELGAEGDDDEDLEDLDFGGEEEDEDEEGEGNGFGGGPEGTPPPSDDSPRP